MYSLALTDNSSTIGGCANLEQDTMNTDNIKVEHNT